MQSMDLRANLGVSLREDTMRSIWTCNETLSAEMDLFYPYSFKYTTKHKTRSDTMKKEKKTCLEMKQGTKTHTLRPKVYQSDQ